jgi:hypothetical protein
LELSKLQIGSWWESQKERDQQQDTDIGGRTILRWIIEYQDGVVWTGFIWLWIGTTGGIGNGPSGSIKCWEILEWLRDWRLLKKGLGPCSYLVVYGDGPCSEKIFDPKRVDITGEL